MCSPTPSLQATVCLTLVCSLQYVLNQLQANFCAQFANFSLHFVIFLKESPCPRLILMYHPIRPEEQNDFQMILFFCLGVGAGSVFNSLLAVVPVVRRYPALSLVTAK
ncbi:hypothetical protein OS493_013186 [Desmophyllum pertusum]|uniref:Uncharacterized protein n=1 Tax=Desmophyllum pertusum TaxID=174260 RepID=A0A9X0CL77_9CNID|nr:hypothetical protein OS493_013186 [Desmophyllum pertusum]